MDKVEEALKSCPFCDGGGWIIEDRDGPLLYRPQCKRCGGGLGGFTARNEAVTTWNRRSPPSPDAEALAGRLEERAEESARFAGEHAISLVETGWLEWIEDAYTDLRQAARLIRGSGR